MLFYNADYSEDAATKHIDRYIGQTVLTLFDFNLNFMCLPLFEDWWKKYYNEEFFDEKDFATRLQEVFTLVSDKIKKGNLLSQIKFLYRLQSNHSTPNLSLFTF